MSETVTASQGGDGGAVAPADEPVATDAEGHAPADTGAAPAKAGDDHDPAARRIARLTARFSATARERDELAARIAQLEQAQASGEQLSTDQRAQIEQAAQRLVEERDAKAKVDAFHEAGREKYADWRDKCEALIAMGADAGLSQLIVEFPNGHDIAAALHDDPDELERIVRMRTPTTRAAALGKIAARIETAAALTPPADGADRRNGAGGGRAQSRAPAPIRPVQGRVTPAFNEYTATTDQLTDYYLAQARKAREARTR